MQLAAALETNRLNQGDGYGPVTAVSADRELNVAATAEGLVVEDPVTHPYKVTSRCPFIENAACPPLRRR